MFKRARIANNAEDNNKQRLFGVSSHTLDLWWCLSNVNYRSQDRLHVITTADIIFITTQNVNKYKTEHVNLFAFQRVSVDRICFGLFSFLFHLFHKVTIIADKKATRT